MRLGRLNHVGVAVPNISDGLRVWRDTMGGHQSGEPFDLPAQGVRVCFVDAPNGQVELLEPLGPETTIARFLIRNPSGGQHHLCFEVPEIGAALADVRAQGCTVLGEPRMGAHGTLVAFVHPRDMGGVLVELMETPRAGGAMPPRGGPR